MKQRRQVVVKALAGLLLVVAAALCTVVIKDTLASRQPQNALPVMEVWYASGKEEGQMLSPSHIIRDRFEWRFLFTPVGGGGRDLTPWYEITPALINPQAGIELEFSWAPKSTTVSFMRSEGVFEEIAGELKAPATAGEYVYRVEAQWEPHRWVQYYFKIQVPDWAG